MKIFSTAPDGNEMAEIVNARYFNLALKRQDNRYADDIDFTGYTESQAVITNKILGRVTRHGMQKHRYSLLIQKEYGEITQRSNVQLLRDHTVGDTLTILYHPQDKSKPIVLKK